MNFIVLMKQVNCDEFHSFDEKLMGGDEKAEFGAGSPAAPFVSWECVGKPVPHKVIRMA